MVCDGCERGFHVGCVRNRLRYPAAAVDDWLCHECSASGRPTKRWTLGAARLLDINALPPSEGDVEELQSSGNVGCRQFFLHSFSPCSKDSSVSCLLFLFSYIIAFIFVSLFLRKVGEPFFSCEQK